MQSRLAEVDHAGEFSAVTGVILAGGKSTRMGTNKAFLPFGGSPFVEIIVRNLRNIFQNVVISANEKEKFAFLQLPVIPDIYRECGPLGGIHAALTYVRTEHIFVVSCDMPLLSCATVRNIISSAFPDKITVCRDAQRIHPLCGIYPAWFRQCLEEYLNSGGRSVMGSLPREKVQMVDAASWAVELRNINTPPEYLQLVQ